MTDVGRGGIPPPLTEGTRRDRPALCCEAGAVGAPRPRHLCAGPPTLDDRWGRGRQFMSTSKHDVEEVDTALSPHAESGVEDGRQVEPLCARACATASASVALPTAGLHPRAASPHSAHLVQVAGGNRHRLASLPLVVVGAVWTRDAEGEPKGVCSTPPHVPLQDWKEK